MQSGHYITTAKTKNEGIKIGDIDLGQWMTFDDDTVTEIQQSEMHEITDKDYQHERCLGSGSAYILIYELQN